MGALLYLLATVVTVPFNVIGLVTVVFKKKATRNKVLKDLAISKDQLSGVYVQFIFNKFMLTKDSKHLFGNPDETISSVFGKNKTAGTLTKFGSYWSDWLNNIDEDHVENAIEDDEF